MRQNLKLRNLKYIIILITTLTSTISLSQEIPSSKRSKDAIERVKPDLINEFNNSDLSLGNSVYLRIFKEEKELEVWVLDSKEYKLFNTYPICTFGKGGLGPKMKEGDMVAPEGFYFVKPNQLNPSSAFHLSFNLGYPNAYDRAHNRTGSALMVHGECVSVGCYAMTDPVIEKIYTIIDAAFEGGQPFFRVHIFPFRMNDYNMEIHKDSESYIFWENLKEGYDFFIDNSSIPPNVTVVNKKYIFN